LSSTKKAYFLWGAATSPYQVEGDIRNNDWDYFTRSKAIVSRIRHLTKPNIFYRGTTQQNLEPAGDAMKVWEPPYYLQDFDLAAQFRLNAFRIGIEWARIEPERDSWNQEAIDHYRNMIKAMLEKGLIPIITLNHLTLPRWVLTPPSTFRNYPGQNLLPSPLRDVPLREPSKGDPFWKSLGGWESNRTVQEFVKYVERVVIELKGLVDYWITICEPVASIIGLGYLAAFWPPGFFLDGRRARMALHNLIEAHVRAYDKISYFDDVDADGDGIPKKVGFTHSMVAVSPARPRKILGITINDNLKAANNFSYFINDYFLNAVVLGIEDVNYLNTLQRGNEDSVDFVRHRDWKNKTDFIGVDYYRRVHIYHNYIIYSSSAKFLGGAFVNNLYLQDNRKQSYGTLSDLGWEIYPKGMYELAIKIKKKWNKPIFITENGIADNLDRYRAPFIVAHLEYLKRAIDDGADIFGYLHWSFMDNYEWLDAYNDRSRFGLFRIKRSDSGLSRQPTKGAKAFRVLIEDSFCDNNNGLVTEAGIRNAKEKFGIIDDRDSDKG
jgi:beta-glucosidase/6-phospho-beta-glucosidase/beta-galactosidase